MSPTIQVCRALHDLLGLSLRNAKAALTIALAGDPRDTTTHIVGVDGCSRVTLAAIREMHARKVKARQWARENLPTLAE